ncbi:MAG: amino acid adenylation domain-containing protein, partial [Acidobacteria bacterium]|nr:amino acid adenylation domain-containing protein [Acidobacteriota bacterium]
LEKSVNAVIHRHGALRTRVITHDNEPFQVIEPEITIKLEYLDFNVYLEENKTQRSVNAVNPVNAVEMAIKFTQKAFILDKDILIRASFIRITGEEALFVLSIHHIIADSFSLNIIANEIFTHYNAYINAGTPSLPPLPPVTAHYADFSQWQYSLTDEMLDPTIYYWKKILKAPLQPLELPTDRPRAAIHIYHQGHQQFTLDSNLTAKLNQFQHQANTNKESILLTIFKILLSKYSGQEEIIVGISDPNRHQPGLEQIVGPIANLLVLRSFLDESQTFSLIQDNIRSATQDAREYKDIPFEKLDQVLKPPKDMSRTVFFDVLFTYRKKNQVQISSEELVVDIIETNLGYGKYDLNLLFQEDSQNTITGYLVYNRDYYHDSSISGFINHYVQLLSYTLENPQAKIAALNFLTEPEKDRILKEFNHTPAQFPGDKTIPQIFMEQTEKNPGRIALIGTSIKTSPKDSQSVQASPAYLQITYSQLNQAAEKLAAQLKQQRVGPDRIVALAVERTLEMVIGILAVLKTGGAYLPIDPYYPFERMQFMIKDSGAGILLNENLELEIMNSSSQPQSLAPGSNVQPHHLAYVIYTSGTTGRPKGALIEHRNVVQLLFHDSFLFHFGAGDIWTLFHSYCFDFSVWEMYGALLYGGKLIIIPRIVAMDTKKFLGVLQKYQVTILNQTPSAFYRLIEEEIKQNNPMLALKYVIFGGEALTPGKLNAWQARYPGHHLINMFGITETTVHVTYKEITTRDIDLSISNIGTPLPTLTLYIVDKQMNLVPIGVPGEMIVGGSGVCRGYLNRPELINKSFRRSRNPFSKGFLAAGGIFYQTGDLARMTHNGEIIYLGRIDKQVKIRGHRIELGEIENRLLQYGPIKDAVVIDRKDKNDDNYLCTYIVLHEPGDSQSDIQPVRTSEIRNYLLKRLPDYMIPAYYVIVDRVPLTGNGKVDRNALPAPEIEVGSDHVKPRNEVEQGIVYILSEVMGIDKNRISVRANFFDIGINSVSLLKIAHRISEEFRVDLPISALFLHPTVEELVEDMKKGYNPGASRRAVLLNHKKADRNLFLLSADGRIYIFKELAMLLEGHFNVYGIMARGLMETGKLPETRQEMLNDFINEMKLVQPEGPYLVGGYCFGAIMSYEITRILEERKNKVTKLIFLDEPAVMNEYTLDHLAKIRRFNKRKDLNEALKKIIKSIKKRLKGEVPGGIQEESIIKTGIMPEDLEARRLEVDKNYRRLFGNMLIFTRTLKVTPILVVKTEGSEKDPDPRWDPRTIARLTKECTEVVSTSGDHFNMFEVPHVSVLARQLIEKI